MPLTTSDRIHRVLLAIGILETMASLAVMACGIANIVFKSRLYHIGHGIWSGIIFAMASSSAVAAGFSKSRGYLVSHIASCVVACIFTIPGLTTLLFIEKMSDTWYTYWTDPDMCRGGCYDPDGEYNRVSLNHWLGNGSPMERYFCDSDSWKSKCHPNVSATMVETTILVLLTVLASLFVLSCSVTCCILCRCRSGRDEVYPLSPADSIIVYTTYAVPSQYHAGYYTHGNINWSIPYHQPDMALRQYQQYQQPQASPMAPPLAPPAPPPPPSYDESQNEQQLHQQLQLQLQQQQQQIQVPIENEEIK